MLKNRPSRFKYVRQFGNPTVEMRQSILPGWEVPTDGLNLDQILRLKEFRADGLDLSASMKKLEKDVKARRVAKIAYKRYEERLASGIQGTARRRLDLRIEQAEIVQVATRLKALWSQKTLPIGFTSQFD
jgi:hypothetical protein